MECHVCHQSCVTRTESFLLALRAVRTRWLMLLLSPQPFQQCSTTAASLFLVHFPVRNSRHTCRKSSSPQRACCKRFLVGDSGYRDAVGSGSSTIQQVVSAHDCCCCWRCQLWLLLSLSLCPRQRNDVMSWSLSLLGRLGREGRDDGLDAYWMSCVCHCFAEAILAPYR